jgi:hypothetical protein
MSNKSHSFAGTLVATISTIAVVGAAGWVILNHQYVLDQFNVWWYQPSSAVATISDRAGMSEKGKFYLYASQTKIETAQEFNNSCVRQEPNSAILGCYAVQKIYVYDVTNPELDGVEEVTASHEMLHAVWERMNQSEKKSLGTLLQTAYIKLDDPKLNERMEYYERTEPGERLNELHSILGTEYTSLGSDLEAHYAKYFTDRTKVVALHAKYESKFESLKSQADALSIELAALKKTIEAQSNQYNSEAVSISTAAAELKQKYNSVDRTSSSEVNAYNAQRQVLLDRIAALDSVKLQIMSQIDEFNKKVEEYNSLVVSTNELNKSLDSTLAPVPSL